jgi:hypothetical protein
VSASFAARFSIRRSVLAGSKAYSGATRPKPSHILSLRFAFCVDSPLLKEMQKRIFKSCAGGATDVLKSFNHYGLMPDAFLG